MSVDHLLSGLDAEQREAVTTEAAPLAVIAAAGSGKTTVLTRRIAYRAATGSAHPRHVLALTFTRDAAAELKRRLRHLDLRDTVDAGTFHGVALRLLRDRALALHQPPPQVAGDRVRLLKEVVTELRLRVDPQQAAADLDWARARLVPPERYEQASRAARRRSAVPAGRYADVFEAYEQLKRRRGVVDFDDLLTGTLRALSTDEEWAAAVRWRYRHLFVDEAQDLNPLQHAVLEAVRAGRPDLCLVGDPRQAIYGWNGADHTTLSRVEEHYPGVTVVTLRTNYRSSPQVVRAAGAALGASGQRDDAASGQPDGRSVTVEVFDDEHAEADGVARHVRDLLLHRSGRQLAVLARTNEQVNLLQAACAAHGIATERTAGRSPLDVAMRDALRCTSRERLAEWVEHALAGGDEVTRRVAEEADRYLSAHEPGTFRAWVDLRAPFDDIDTGPHHDAVALLTFHAAKGREWWGVVVTGAEDGLVPHASAVGEAALAEEARLFYVALTRAEHHLVVTRSNERGGRAAAPSRWLDAVARTAEADRPVPPPAPVRTHHLDPMAPYREWRAAVARVSGQPERAVCSDAVLRSLHDHPPADSRELAARLGITVSAAQRLRPLPSG